MRYNKYKKEVSKTSLDLPSMNKLDRHKLLDERLKRSLELFEQLDLKDSSQESNVDNNKCGKVYTQCQSAPRLSPPLSEPHTNPQAGVFHYVYNSQSSTCSINSVNHQVKYSIDTTEYESFHEDSKTSSFDSKFEEINFKIESIERKISSIQEKLFGTPLDIFAKPSASNRRTL